MLKRFVPALIVALALLSAPLAALAELKIGFVNAALVLEKVPQADAARKALEQEFRPREAEIVAMQGELKKLRDRLDRDGEIMSASGRNSLEREVRQMTRDLKRTRDEFREDFSIRRNEVLSKLQRQALETVKALAEEQKYDLIVTNDGVVVASVRIDITDEVVERMRSQFKGK